MRKWRRKKRSAALVLGEDWESLTAGSYTRLADNPEVQMAVGYISQLVASMTIRLMRNTEQGDVRVRNALSRKVDISPYSLTTRYQWMSTVVKNMLLEGNQIILPHTSQGLLTDLQPLPPAQVSILPQGDSYTVRYRGREFAPDEILHFAVNPDPDYPWTGQGYRAALKDVVQNLKQAGKTKNGFMSSKWKPSIIVKVDALAEEFSGKAGRKRLLEEYLQTSEAGEPWMIPTEQFEVQQVKPLSLNDLALNEAVTIDKRAVAGIIGVPRYVVGAGDFSLEEHRNFINTKIMPLAQSIEQELTKKLLVSSDMYFRLSSMSLYSYDIKELADVGGSMYVRGIMLGNEVRDWLHLSPLDGLEKRVILENYIPADMIGDQKKLNPKGGETL